MHVIYILMKMVNFQENMNHFIQINGLGPFQGTQSENTLQIHIIMKKTLCHFCKFSKKRKTMVYINQLQNKLNTFYEKYVIWLHNM